MTLKTPLHSKHIEMGAKMGAFAGYDMPLYYPLGVMKEHLWTREKAGLFDVSHMGQILLEGEGVVAFLERLTPSGFADKKDGQAQYTVLLNEAGGILDDLIVTRLDAHRFFIVVNAGRKDVDIAWIKRHLPDDVRMTCLDDRVLLAIQGPKAESVIAGVMKLDIADIPYMGLKEVTALCGNKVYVSRLGYTGEDGFEISGPASFVEKPWHFVSAHSDVEPVGLAARDSLRLEMGYPLYGHDLDESISPVEAGLSWIVSKNTDGYFGYERIQKELSQGVTRKRIGLMLTGKGVAREGAEIIDADGAVIGTLSSGGFSPSLQSSIGMGYVDTPHAIIGAAVSVRVRGRAIAAKIVAMPFVAPKTKSRKAL